MVTAVSYKSLDPRVLAGEIEILSVQGRNVDGTDNDGLIAFSTHPSQPGYRIICRKGYRLEVKATNNGPAGTWTMPIKCPTHIGNVTVTKAEGEDFMTIAIEPDIFGDWELSEDLINRGLTGIRFEFVGLIMNVVV